MPVISIKPGRKHIDAHLKNGIYTVSPFVFPLMSLIWSRVDVQSGICCSYNSAELWFFINLSQNEFHNFAYVCLFLTEKQGDIKDINWRPKANCINWVKTLKFITKNSDRKTIHSNCSICIALINWNIKKCKQKHFK